MGAVDHGGRAAAVSSDEALLPGTDPSSAPRPGIGAPSWAPVSRYIPESSQRGTHDSLPWSTGPPVSPRPPGPTGAAPARPARPSGAVGQFPAEFPGPAGWAPMAGRPKAGIG